MNDKTQKIAAELAPKIRQAIANGVTDKFVEQEIQSAIEKATDFYKRRCDALQQAQKEMRDPERQIVCDILANGFRDKAIEKSRAAHASEQLYRIKEGTDLSYLPHWLIPVDEASESDLLRAASECSFEAGRGVERAAHAREQRWTADKDGTLWPLGRFVGQYASEIAAAHNATLQPAHASEPQFNLETLEGRKAAWAWLQERFGNPLVVTKGGVPFEDQAEGIRQFKAAAHASEQ